MFQIPQSRIVYHGTNLPPGSFSSSSLRPPSVDNPFFVASHPRIAMSYMENGGNNSLYVLRLKDIPEKISLNLYTEEGRGELRGKLPRTADLIDDYFATMSDNTPSLWLLSQIMVLFLECSMDNGGHSELKGMVERAERKLADIWSPDKMPVSKFVKPLVELGLVTVRGGILEISNPRMRAAMGKVHGDLADYDYFEADIYRSQHGAGRVIKAVVNRAAVSLGYHMVGDFDSSGTSNQYHLDGREYAVLDKDVFDYAVESTIPEDEVYVASEALGRGLEFKGSGMNDPDEKARHVLERVGDGWIRRDTFPNFVKARATEIVVPKNITHVSDFAMCDFDRLEKVEFSEKTEHFGHFCLAYCLNLKKVIFKSRKFNEFGSPKEVGGIFSSGSKNGMKGLEIVVPEGFTGNLGNLEEKGVRITHG